MSKYTSTWPEAVSVCSSDSESHIVVPQKEIDYVSSNDELIENCTENDYINEF